VGSVRALDWGDKHQIGPVEREVFNAVESQPRVERAAGQRPVAKPSVHGRLLALQSVIGNRGFQRLTAKPAPARVVARYDTGEHAQFGDDRVVYVRGDVQITESEMIALGGDLYERPEDLNQADLAELRTLVALVRRDRNAYLHVGGAKHVSNAEWQDATKKGAHRTKSFVDLANDNATHYAPREKGSDKRDHKAEWERIHRQALDIAHTATTADDARRALAYNAFAAHFLTDAFAAGHLISKQDVIDFANADWRYDDTWGTLFKESRVTREIAERLLADPRSGPKLRGYKIRIASWGDMSLEKLSELLYGMADDHPELFWEPLVKLIHDSLGNRGVEVTNARGDGPWILPGDGSLEGSPETIRIGNAAVTQSEQNLVVAHATAGPLDYQTLFDRVWAYTPRPTEKGRLVIDRTVGRLGNPLNKKTPMLFADWVADHIDAIIAGLRQRDRLATPEEAESK
jgi:hypothetical protein